MSPFIIRDLVDLARTSHDCRGFPLSGAERMHARPSGAQYCPTRGRTRPQYSDGLAVSVSTHNIYLTLPLLSSHNSLTLLFLPLLAAASKRTTKLTSAQYFARKPPTHTYHGGISGLLLLLRRRAPRRARHAGDGRVRALRQAAGARQRRLHVQRGHALLQRRVPARADAVRCRLRQAGRAEAAAVLRGDGILPWAAAVQEGVDRKLTGRPRKILFGSTRSKF